MPVSSMSTEMANARLVFLLELADEAVAIGAIVDAFDPCVDDLQQSQILREHFLEHVANALGVLLGHREDDGLAGKSTAAILDADVHDLFPLPAERVAVRDEHFKFGAGVVDGVGVEALLDESVAVFLGETSAPDALALESGLRLIQSEVDEMSFLDGLLVGVEERRRLVAAVEYAERVAVDESGRCRGQTDHAGIEVLDDFGEAIEDRAVRFVEDDEVEETG